VIPEEGEPFQPGRSVDAGGEPLSWEKQNAILQVPLLLACWVTREAADDWLARGRASNRNVVFLEHGEGGKKLPLAGTSVMELVRMAGGKTSYMGREEKAHVVTFPPEQADNAAHALVAIREVMGEKHDPAHEKGEIDARFVPAVLLSEEGEVLGGAAALRDQLPLAMLVLVVDKTMVEKVDGRNN
jgi:hypothetical protein